MFTIVAAPSADSAQPCERDCLSDRDGVSNSFDRACPLALINAHTAERPPNRATDRPIFLRGPPETRAESDSPLHPGMLFFPRCRRLSADAGADADAAPLGAWPDLSCADR